MGSSIARIISSNADRLEGNPNKGRTTFNYLESRFKILIKIQTLESAKSLLSALGCCHWIFLISGRWPVPESWCI